MKKYNRITDFEQALLLVGQKKDWAPDLYLDQDYPDYHGCACTSGTIIIADRWLVRVTTRCGRISEAEISISSNLPETIRQRLCRRLSRLLHYQLGWKSWPVLRSCQWMSEKEVLMACYELILPMGNQMD